MPSLRGFAVGLVALLAADAVVAGPCKPRTTSGVSTAATQSSASTTIDVSVTTESVSSTSVTSSETSTIVTVSTTDTASSIETASASSIVSSISETATSTEFLSTVETTTTAEPTLTTEVTSETITSTELASTTQTTTAAETTTTTEAISTTTTTEAAPTLPTISNPGFDDNNTGDPWVRSGSAGVSNGAVFWKLSQPNVMVIRPGSSIAQSIDGLSTNRSYRIRFYWVKFDTPSATGGCQLSVTMGGQDLGAVLLLPPRTPNNMFEEFVSPVYQPSSGLEELKIGISCTAPGQTTRHYVENVSIELA